MKKGDKYKQLKENIRKLVNANPNFPIDAVVKSVENDTCTVELASGFEISDVRLKATSDGSDSLLVVPAIGSQVLMISMDGTVDNMTVIKCDKADKLIYNNSGLHLEIEKKSKKILVKNNQVNLYTILSDLAALLKQLKVSTPMGPSGTPLPDSILAIEKFENDFKQILKEN